LTRSKRIEGVDVARGVASLLMIQGHAYDAFVAPEHKSSAAYLFTRLLGSLPLPAFLLLAGAAIVLRVDAAQRRGESAASVRSSIVKRGFSIVAWGYVVNLAYALLDGSDGMHTLLRADVLHVIGLSIVAFAMLGIRGRRAPETRRMAIAALGLSVVPTLLCPWLSPLGSYAEGPLRFAVALFVDVPSVTLMPFVPLVAWLAIGTLSAMAMLRAHFAIGAAPNRAGAPVSFLVVLAMLALFVAIVASLATDAMLAMLGGSLTRAHPAVWANVLDLGARGLLVLALGALAALLLPARVRSLLVRLGQGSLIAYVVHIPLCYGLFGRPWQGQLDMFGATFGVLVLMLLSYAAVRARDAIRPGRSNLVGTSLDRPA
jgi:fucose 4-O-acetylase-like acetyltransferase